MHVPCFADEGCDWGFAGKDCVQGKIVFDGRVRSAGIAETGDFGVFQAELCGFEEKLHFFFVAGGIAALDVIEAELVQMLCDSEFVGERKTDAFSLHSIAKSCIVNSYSFHTPDTD
ncbi:MAG: hypothetical protein BWY69_00345 [Planctomycetes bacterium ADurb.Bin401]|nr:MAG: hypothetical protein BWY69_00345 [Planctomycetes bacterium ADurb.Bin401]